MSPTGRTPTDPALQQIPIHAEIGDEIREAIKKILPQHDPIRPEVRALAERGKITLAEWEEFRGNSFEMELLIPELTDEALIHCANHMLDNCQIARQRPFVTYNEAVIGLIAPELIARLAPKDP
jgi:hypothetical protein